MYLKTKQAYTQGVPWPTCPFPSAFFQVTQAFPVTLTNVTVPRKIIF